jgi:hypothetical protein
LQKLDNVLSIFPNNKSEFIICVSFLKSWATQNFITIKISWNTNN